MWNSENLWVNLLTNYLLENSVHACLATQVYYYCEIGAGKHDIGNTETEEKLWTGKIG